MAEETDMPALADQPRMLHQLDRVGYTVEIGVENFLAVHNDFDVPAARGDFLRVPFTRRLERAFLRGDTVINRAVILLLAQLAPLAAQRSAFLQNLNLHP